MSTNHAVAPRAASPSCRPSVLLGAAVILSFGCASPAPPPLAAEPPPVTSSSRPPGPVDFSGEPLEVGYLAVRFVMFGGFGSLSAVLVERTKDGAGVKVGTAVGPRYYTVTREQWDLLATELERTGFWTKPERDPVPSPRVKDGDTWVLEGLRDGVRHRVIRQTPRIRTDERGLSDFLALCGRMAALGKIQCGDAGCLPIDYVKAQERKFMSTDSGVSDKAGR